MSSKKPLLKDVLGDLVGAGKRDWVGLGRGLRVAFTPASENPTPVGRRHRFRLCLSRAGTAVPNEHEATTVWAHLLKSGVVKRPFVREVFERNGAGNWVIEWAVGEQRPLIEVGEEKRERGEGGILA